MKKITCIIVVLLCCAAQAQHGFGTSTPDLSSVVDMTASNKGALLPRVALTSITDTATITSAANSLTVYNTATAGTAPNDVSPGYYYWSTAASKWIRVLDQTNTRVTSMSGTSPISVANGTTTPVVSLGILPIANGGTNTTAAPTNGGVDYGTGTAHAFITAGTNGQLLTSTGATAPIWTTPSATATLVGGIGTTGTPFNVNNLAFTLVPGSSFNFTVPAGGKTMFLNYMLGVDLTSVPAGAGNAFYTAQIFLDASATTLSLTLQEPATTQGQFGFTISGILNLTAGLHSIDVRITRSANNGVTSGANQLFNPLSNVFSAAYLN